MRKLLAVVLAMLLVAFSCIGAFAEEVTNDTHKDSLQNYAGKGNLKYTTEQVLSFDSLEDIYSESGVTLDTSNKKEGSASLSKTYASDTGSIRPVFETTHGAMNFGISDRLKQTVKMWVYVNDIDLLYCDHDGVYDTPQKGSGTIFISFAKDGGSNNKYSLQHTIEGSGWHLIEVSFNTHNNEYPTWKKTDITKITWMNVRVQAYAGLEIKFDGLTKYTYSNDGYVEPECPNGGRWISTCDYDSLDGTVVTEWYASSFDLNDKTQGSSSVSITGRLEHVDYRCVWSGLDVPVDKSKDILHFDMYISDKDLISNDFQARLAQAESGEGQASYSFGYDTINRYANLGDGIKDGWNSIDMPMSSTSSSIDTAYYAQKGGLDFRADRLVFFWAGTSKDEWYTIKYDNIYLYTDPSIGSASNSNGALAIPPATELGPKEGADDGEPGFLASFFLKDVDLDKDGNLDVDYVKVAIACAVAAILLAVIVAIVIIVILPKVVGKKKNAKKAKPAVKKAAAESAEKPQETETEEQKSEEPKTEDKQD